MTVPYVPSPSNLRLLETWQEYILAWKEANPGELCKIGGKQESNKRQHDTSQYNPRFFNTIKAIVFPGTFTDSRLAAWLELQLIKFAYDIGIGINNNRDSPYNMANLPGEDYSEANLGCIYLVPVHTYITTQVGFKKVHVRRHNALKALIDAGDYEKGKHQNPHLRKKHKKQDLSVRKKQDRSVRKKPGHSWTRTSRRQSDTEIQKRFQHGAFSCASRFSEVLALSHPRKRD